MPDSADTRKDADPKGIGENIAGKAKEKAGDALWDAVLKWLLPIAVAGVVGGAAGAVTGRVSAVPAAPVVAPLAPVPSPAVPLVAPSGAARLAVRSRPPGGRVTLDGRLVGQTPVERIDVDPGAHAVVVDLAGYTPYLGTVQVPAGGLSVVDAELVAAPAEPVAATSAAPVRMPRAYAAPRRDCDGEHSTCTRHCDDAAFHCRASCEYCGGCVTSMTQEQCTSICNTCRQGCEQNERFCASGCEGQYSSCRSSLFP